MPEIEIRPADLEALPTLLALDAAGSASYTWQMEVLPPALDEAGYAVSLRRVRLPRPAKVAYARTRTRLSETLPHADMLLQAQVAGQSVAWCALLLNRLPGVVWISDMAVHPTHRRQGVGSSLVLATLNWAAQVQAAGVMLEIASRNDPAVQFARRLGFEFNGYQNHYYGPHSAALFFYKSI